jgi:phosphohistidine phosphatase
MKTVLLVRHAKSSWDTGALSDFERPLNDRGKKDAPDMAQRLVAKKIPIDTFIASPAKRAKRTAQLFVKEFNVSEEDIIYKSELYHAPPEAFYELIDKLEESQAHIAIFSHNPGITAFANTLTDDVELDNIPTCGVFAIKVEVEKWKDFKSAKKEFWFFDFPKHKTE